MTRTPQGVYVQQDLRPRFRPVVTWGLTATLIAVFVVQGAMPGFTARFFVEPQAVRDGQWWRILTGAFLHGNVLHLAANAYFGWAIGARVERYIGPWRLMLITLSAMVGSGLAVSLLGTVPAVGFSGVLYGWLASWLAFHLTPRFPGLRLSGPQRSAYLQLLGANLLLSLRPGISLLGHAGGFVAGFAAAFALGLTRPTTPAAFG
ncbi:MAG: rhomboid family intramembrane serine protease [Deltaproteobacteria bacterium]|nr:rhomboid family intramembrane serine protease [Deltaproteobacteria bacterium]